MFNLGQLRRVSVTVHNLPPNQPYRIYMRAVTGPRLLECNYSHSGVLLNCRWNVLQTL